MFWSSPPLTLSVCFILLCVQISGNAIILNVRYFFLLPSIIKILRTHYAGLDFVSAEINRVIVISASCDSWMHSPHIFSLAAYYHIRRVNQKPQRSFTLKSQNVNCFRFFFWQTPSFRPKSLTHICECKSHTNTTTHIINKNTSDECPSVCNIGRMVGFVPRISVSQGVAIELEINSTKDIRNAWKKKCWRKSDNLILSPLCCWCCCAPKMFTRERVFCSIHYYNIARMSLWCLSDRRTVLIMRVCASAIVAWLWLMYVKWP